LQGSQILEAAKALYISESKSTHDERFISALDQALNLQEIYIDNAGTDEIELIKQWSGAIIASPLSTGVSFAKESSTSTIIGICLAYEINEEAKSQEKYDEVLRNINRCAAIVCDCDYIESEIRNRFAFKGEILKIAYGCDQSKFLDTPFQDSPEMRIISTRNWTPIHSNQSSIAALEILKSTGVNFQAKFYGTGPELTQALIDSVTLQFSNDIQFLGKFNSEELPKFLSESEIYISASISDGSSVSLLEAMAAGRICVCRDFPSNREWINDSQNGFLFSSPEELSRILTKISRLNYGEKLAISSAAKKTVKYRANWEKLAMEFNNFVMRSIN
jgi:glycosyltransferase involved in cell wall biosynthesis